MSKSIERAIKNEAVRLGFDACGIATATRLQTEADLLDEWLDRGYHGSMQWMAEHREKRIDPQTLVPGARSVISVIHTYYASSTQQPEDPAVGKISRYAWNKDYHKILRKKLSTLLRFMNEHYGPVNGRAFVDSAPVMDKVWAQRSGLGWVGKHSNLINRQIGSYFFIGELIVDIDLKADRSELDHCGTCTRCIDACPTNAIVDPYVVDGSRCISYLTIENRDSVIDPDLAEHMENWVFGCDICQEVCPWNKFAADTSDERFLPVDDRTNRKLADWSNLTQDEFDRIFMGSPVRRTGYEGFARNVEAARRNQASDS